MKQSIVKAEFSQQQIIQTSSFKDPFILPHPGYMSSIFSSGHPGVDIATGLGMPIHPINSGKVMEVTFGFFGLGHSVVVEHEQGIKSTYGHMGRIFVSVGDVVTQHSILGDVGLTGHTSGPHTHLETTKNGEYFDPQMVLPILAKWPESAGIAPSGEGKINSATAKPTPTPKIVDKKDLNKLVGINVYQKQNENLKPLPLLLPLKIQP